jgi:pimeloyl-ACP methyl ester carboxylesterase
MKTLFKIIGCILSGLFAIALLVAVSALGYRAFLQHRDAEVLVIHTTNGINESRYVRIGGIDQWIQIRGQDVSNPVVLLLNGGPGASWIRVTQAFLPWEKYFTLVQWDQRGAGRTYAANRETVAASMTMMQMTSDAIEVIDYLRTHLKKDKIILLGHSWGSILGIHVAQQRPNFLYCFVGTGQVASMPQLLQAAYVTFLEQARQADNMRGVHELEALGAPPYTNYQQYVTLFTWSGHERTAAMRLALKLPFGGFAVPGYSLADHYNEMRGFGFSQRILCPIAWREDLPSVDRDFKVPIIFIEGSNDTLNPMADAKSYFDKISAPKKEFITIPGGSHFVLFEEPDVFLKEMLAHVQPLI